MVKQLKSFSILPTPMSPTGRLCLSDIDHPKELLPFQVSCRYQTSVQVDALSFFLWLQYSSADTLNGGRGVGGKHGLLSVIGCLPVFCSGSFLQSVICGVSWQLVVKIVLERDQLLQTGEDTKFQNKLFSS